MRNLPEPEKLPDTLGELLRDALNDLTRAENSPDYRINMDVWHMPDNDSHGGGKYDLAPDGDPVCEVCLGGALLAFGAEAGAEKGDYLTPDLDIMPERVATRMVVLDELRDFQIEDAAHNLYEIPYCPELRTERQHELMDKARQVAIDFLYSDDMDEVEYEVAPNVFHASMGMLRDLLLQAGI